MHASLKTLCNQIQSAEQSARPALASKLIQMADSLGEAFSMEDAHEIASVLSPIGSLEIIGTELRKERNPERIRALMTEAMKLRSQLAGS
jgi:hypothetical protein